MRNIIFLCCLLINTIAVGQQRVFEDNFDSNSNNWKLVDIDGYHSAIKEGQLSMTSKSKGSYIIVNDITLNFNKNYTIETSFKLEETVNTKAASLLKFGMSKEGSFEFGYNGEGKAIINKIVKGKSTPIVPFQEVEGLDPWTNNNLKIEKFEDKMTFVINNKVWKVIEPVPFYGPKIGFKVGSQKTLKVDYLKVSYIKTSTYLENTVNEPQYSNQQEAIASVIDIGEMAPTVFGDQPNGISFSLDSLKGKYVLVHFWGSWDGNAREKTVKLNKAFKKFSKDNFTILAFGVEKDYTSWNKAIKNDKIEKWKHVSDMKYKDSKIVKAYQVEELPKNFLIDPVGKIIAIDLNENFLLKKLQELTQ